MKVALPVFLRKLHLLFFLSISFFFFSFTFSNEIFAQAGPDEGCTGLDTHQRGVCWDWCLDIGSEIIADEQGLLPYHCEPDLFCCVAPVNRCIGDATNLIGICPLIVENCPTTSFTMIDGDCQGRPEWGPCCVSRYGPTAAPATAFQPSPCSITSCEIQNVPGCWDDPDIEGVLTGIGCIPTHPLWFIKIFQNILIALSGGIVFLLMIVGAAFILTSQGQPERIKRGKEIFVGAITGLLLLIFAVFLLRLTIRDILNLL